MDPTIAAFCNTLTPLTAEMDFFGTRPMTVWLGLTLLTLLLAYSFRKHLYTNVAAAWAFFAVYALAMVEFPAGTRGCYARAFEASAGSTFIELVFFPIAIILLPERYIKWSWASVLVLVAMDLPALWLGRNGLMISPSFDAAFLALALPFAPWWLALPALATIFTVHGSTAALVLAAQGAAFVAVKSRGWPARARLAAWAGLGIALCVVLVIAAHHEQVGHLFDRPVRMRGYERAMSFWLYGVPEQPFFPIRWGAVAWYQVALGFGPGSFTWISMMLSKMQAPFDLNLHSDWLQIPFETGLLGLGLFLGVCIKCVYKSAHDARMQAALFGIAACMVTYHPLRFFPTMLLIALVARRALYPAPLPR